MRDWPLHVTLADVFAIDGSPDDLPRALAERLRSTLSFACTVTGVDWFGEDKSVAVKLVDKTEELQQLHMSVLEVLQQYKVRFNSPEYMQEGFKPHSTDQKDSQLRLEDIVKFNVVTLIDMFPGENPFERRILGTMHF